MKNLSIIFATVLLFAGVTVSNAQDDNNADHRVGITIPTVALVDVEGSGGAIDISLTPTISNLEAGNAVNFASASNSSLWLNYTSIISGNSNNGNGNGNSDERKINVKLDESDNLPAGVSLILSVGNITSGKGNKGDAVSGSITISEDATDVVTGIGSCYTESGTNKGHQLTYGLQMDNDNYADLLANDYSVTVTYTITD